MVASSAEAMRSTAARYGPRKGPVVDSTVAMSTNYACSKATARRAVSSATSITSFSCCKATAIASA
jgi:hypothetical protein